MMSPQSLGAASFSSSNSSSSKAMLVHLKAPSNSLLASDWGTSSSSSLVSADWRIVSRSSSFSSSVSSVLNKSSAPNLRIMFSSVLLKGVAAFLLSPPPPEMTVLPVVSMDWMTRWSSTILFLALWMMSSSTLLLATNLKILTSSFWPILWALAMACRSFCGFQSLSKMITLLAVCRLIPRPPALVESRKQKSLEFGSLNCAMLCFLLSLLTPPSSLWWG